LIKGCGKILSIYVGEIRLLESLIELLPYFPSKENMEMGGFCEVLDAEILGQPYDRSKDTPYLRHPIELRSNNTLFYCVRGNKTSVCATIRQL